MVMGVSNIGAPSFRRYCEGCGQCEIIANMHYGNTTAIWKCFCFRGCGSGHRCVSRQRRST